MKAPQLLRQGRSRTQSAWDEYKSAGYNYDAYFSKEISKFDAAIAARD